MAEAALLLSIKFTQTPSDTFCLSLLATVKLLLFTPASQSAAESAHTVLLSTFTSLHLQVVKGH